MSRILNPKWSEVAAWRRLLSEASACANNPARPTGDLFVRTCTTAKACVPTGELVRSNPWLLLRNAAVVFCARKADRPWLAADLGAKAEACAELLGAVGATEPPRRFRADLDG